MKDRRDSRSRFLKATSLPHNIYCGPDLAVLSSFILMKSMHALAKDQARILIILLLGCLCMPFVIIPKDG